MKTLRRAGVYAGAALALLALGAVLYAWYVPPKERTLYRAVPVPYIAERVPALKAVQTEERCVPTVVYKPTPKQAEKLGPIPAGSDVLTAADVKPLPYGGRVTVTIPRPTPERLFPEAEVTVVPKRQPLFEWMGVRDVSGLVGVDQDLGRVVALRLGMDVMRTGPAIWRVEAGSFGGTHDQRLYVMAGVKVRF